MSKGVESFNLSKGQNTANLRKLIIIRNMVSEDYIILGNRSFTKNVSISTVTSTLGYSKELKNG